MNVLAPLSCLMTSNLITVEPEDKLEKIKQIFNGNKIHHLPVARSKDLIGIISKTDSARIRDIHFILNNSAYHFGEGK